MKRVYSQPVMRNFREIDYERERDNSIAKSSVRSWKDDDDDDDDNEEEIDAIADHIQCMGFKKRPQSSDRSEELYLQKHGPLRQKQKGISAMLEKQMKARWALEDLIEEQLSRFHARYSRAVAPTHLEDLSRLLMPKWTSPLELAALSWLGDWRPSAMLDLLSSMRHSFPSLSESNAVKQMVSKLIHDIHIEEAVIDEEMAEIQANCILHLPFGPAKNRSSGPALACIQSEFKKIHLVIVKAQNLRFKVLELIVKKVLSQSDAVEFLIAFSGIQDSVHQIGRQHKMLKGPVSLPIKSLGSRGR